MPFKNRFVTVTSFTELEKRRIERSNSRSADNLNASDVIAARPQIGCRAKSNSGFTFFDKVAVIS